jgi:hypothetical protein
MAAIAAANDAVCAWAGSLGGEDGITIVAGTSSIGYGERKGRAARAGGWGEPFSDEGSAYWIHIQAPMLTPGLGAAVYAARLAAQPLSAAAVARLRS